MKFKVGDKVVSRVTMETHYGSLAGIAGFLERNKERVVAGKTTFKTIDAKPGDIGTIIETDIHDDCRYYTANFSESGGFITDCHEAELSELARS